MRVVVDTNVFVSAFLSPRGAPAQIFQRLEQDAFELVISEAILDEYKAALQYDRTKKVHKLTDEQIARVIEDLRSLAILVAALVTPIVVASDPYDDKLFACALAGGAEIIVSGDLKVQAVKRYQDIQVLAPAIFLALLDSSAAPNLFVH